MLRLKIDDLENEIEDVKLFYEIMKLKGEKSGFFIKSDICYFENDILELTDDLSEISNILKIDGTNILRVNCNMIDFRTEDKSLQDVVEYIKKRCKKCNVIKLSSTQNDTVLYFYNCSFTKMLKEYHSYSFKYRFYFDFFEIKNK